MSDDAEQQQVVTEEQSTAATEEEAPVAAETQEQTAEEPTPAPQEEEEEEVEEEIEYVCPPEFDEREEMRKMFVGGLDKETTDEEFKELFAAFGEVTDFIIIRKESSMKSDRLFGFITFAHCDELEECLLGRPHKYKEKELDVKRAVPRGQDDQTGQTGHFKVKKLHVGNVPPGFTAKELKTYLRTRHPKKYGTIEEINLLKTKDEQGNLTDKNRGFGFIMVSSEDFADRISIAEAKFTLNSHSMKISKAKPRNSDGMYILFQFNVLFFLGWGEGHPVHFLMYLINLGARSRPPFRGDKSVGPYGHPQGGWEDWSGYGGGGYGYGGYGYGGGYGGYGYGGYYDGYGGAYGGAGYNSQRPGRGGNTRFKPY